MTAWKIMVDARHCEVEDVVRQQSLLLSHLVPALKRGGHDVLALRSVGQQPVPDTLTVETPAPATTAGAADLFALVGWPPLVEQHGVNLVLGLHGMVPLGRCTARRVAWINDLSAVRSPLASPALRVAWGTRLAAINNAADAMVTPSRWLGDQLRLMHPNASIHPVPPLLDPQEPARGVRARLNALGVVPDLYLCVPFSAQARRALPVLLEAFGALPLDWDVQLLLLGSEAQWGAAQFLDVLPQERAEAVILADAMDAATRLDVLAHAGAVLVPSWHDGALLGAMEAVAMGVPIIASPNTAAVELIGRHTPTVDPDDVDGWTVAMENALHRKGHKKRASNADKVVAAWLAVLVGVMR